MQRYNEYMKPKSRSTLCLLALCGSVIMFFSLVLIGCAFTINYDEDFELDNVILEANIQSQFNYTQYWAGIPFFVTGALVLFSGIFQRSRGLTITTLIFCIISLALTLVVLTLDGVNLSVWSSQGKLIAYWNSKSGYDCGTNDISKACTCTGSANPQVIRLSNYECEIVEKLSALYGAVIGSAIFVKLFSMCSIVLIIKSLSWKPLINFARGHYNGADEFYVDTGRRTPSHIEMPVARRYYNESTSGSKPFT